MPSPVYAIWNGTSFFSVESDANYSDGMVRTHRKTGELVILRGDAFENCYWTEYEDGFTPAAATSEVTILDHIAVGKSVKVCLPDCGPLQPQRIVEGHILAVGEGRKFGHVLVHDMFYAFWVPIGDVSQA